MDLDLEFVAFSPLGSIYRKSIYAIFLLNFFYSQ